MKKKLILFLVCSASITVSLQNANAQSWLIAGNNNTTALSRLGTNNLIPLGLYTNGGERVHIDVSGRVGIGTTTPVNILTVKSTVGTNPASSWLNGLTSPVFVGFADNASSEFVLATASNVGVRRSVIQGRKSRGTLDAPAVVVNNDYLTSFLASGYDGSTFQNPATIDFFVDGVPSPGNVPARISFVTGSNQATRLERLKVGSTGNFNFNDNQLTIKQSTGNVGIGVAAGDARLEINQNSSVLVPQLLLKETQADYARLNFGNTATSNIWAIAALPNTSNAGSKLHIFYQGIGDIMTIQGDRKVGIGTTSPAYLLDVAGRMRVRNDGGSAGIWFTNAANTLDRSFYGMASDDLVGLFGSGYGFGLAMNVNNGKVGINNLDPAYALDVTGRTRLRSGGGTAGTWFMNEANTLDRAFIGMLNDDLVGFYGALSGWSVLMNVNNGNLGIGTSDPGNYKVTVAHGSFGFDIQNASTGNNWELYTSNNLNLYYKNNFRGSFDETTGVYSPTSDERLKTDIKPMTTMLEKINKLKPSTYQFKADKDKKEVMGFIAQDVLKIFPSLVTRNVIKERDLDLYTLDYSGFGVIAVKGIQELQPIIEEQKKINEDQKETIQDLTTKMKDYEAKIDQLTRLVQALVKNNNGAISIRPVRATLSQNSPNPPVANSTRIGYSLPDGVNKAELLITDIAGRKLKQIRLNNSGDGYVNINTSLLAKSTYTYSLYINGALADSKKMILSSH